MFRTHLYWTSLRHKYNNNGRTNNSAFFRVWKINFKVCACYFLFFHQTIALQKLWKLLFLIEKAVHSQDILIFVFFSLPFLIQKDKWKLNTVMVSWMGFHELADVIFEITQKPFIIHHQTWWSNKSPIDFSENISQPEKPLVTSPRPLLLFHNLIY